MKFNGIYIAPVTPVLDDGRVDCDRFLEVLSFLLEKGVDGFCIGGGTSEYIHFTAAERIDLFREARSLAGEDRKIFFAIGASSYPRVMDLAREAEHVGVDAVLLPMPHFFTYSQDDLEFFCRSVSREVDSPVLLYNLPFFTNPLGVEATLRLLEEEDGIAGIKDSSGETGRFRQFGDKFGGDRSKDISLIIGQDPFAYDALEAGWDGIISGLGCLCPELLVCLHRSFNRGDRDTAVKCRDLIKEINTPVSGLPVPWAIRFGLEVRGLDCGPAALPLSEQRIAEKREFQSWFENWLAINSGLWQNE